MRPRSGDVWHPQGPPSLKELTMLHLLHYPRELIAERVVFTPADQAQIASCRGSHNRLGFAYQMGFLQLTGRFPLQQPLEILGDLLAFVAQELALDPTAIADYAQRQATISAHQELIRLHLGFRPFAVAERDALSRFLLQEATRLEHMPALLAQAEAFLRDRRILLPALSTLRRLASEQREQARVQLYTRMMACLPPDLPAHLDAFLQVDTDARLSPPSLPSRAVPRPWHPETPEALLYPILSGLSRLRIPAPRPAARRLRRPPRRAGGAAGAASG